MRKIYWLAFGLTIALVSLSLAGCSQGSSGQGVVSSGEAVIKATEFKFEPASLKVEVGKPIKLVLRNEGKVEHNVTLPGLTSDGKAIEVVAKAGETASVQITPDKAGTYEIACTLPAHKDAGMIARLEVVAGQ